jgi:hypothetical protein
MAVTIQESKPVSAAKQSTQARPLQVSLAKTHPQPLSVEQRIDRVEKMLSKKFSDLKF